MLPFLSHVVYLGVELLGRAFTLFNLWKSYRPVLHSDCAILRSSHRFLYIFAKACFLSFGPSMSSVSMKQSPYPFLHPECLKENLARADARFIC